MSISAYREDVTTDVPIRATENGDCTRNSVGLASVGLDPDPSGMLHAKQVIHDLETLLPLGKVNTADVHAGLELALRVVAEEGENGNNGGGRDVQRQLILEDRELLDILGKALGEVGTVGVELLSGLGV